MPNPADGGIIPNNPLASRSRLLEVGGRYEKPVLVEYEVEEVGTEPSTPIEEVQMVLTDETIEFTTDVAWVVEDELEERGT